MGVLIPTKNTSICPEMEHYMGFTVRQIMQLRDRTQLITEEYAVNKLQLATIIRCKELEATQLFKIFDRENRGKIDVNEFLCGLVLISQTTLAEKAEVIFKLYDFDGNLYITRDELVIMLMNTLSALAHMSKTPSPKVEDVERLSVDVLKSSDTNNDKRVSFPEFLSYTTKSKEILGLLQHYMLITKDDLRCSFVKSSESDLPDCDSDLENEVMRKGGEKIVPLLESRVMAIERAATAILGKSLKPETPADASMLEDRLISPTKLVPKDFAMGDEESPDANLELEYIHGYRCTDTRNNLRYNKAGDIIYHAASVGIVLNQGLNTQKHFFEHRNEIVCLAIHPNMIYAATGDIGSVSHICIWDTTTMECLARIAGLLKKGIAHLCFSSDGNYLAASATDEYHCVAIYDWDKCTTTAKNVANKAKKANNNALVATGQVTPASLLSLLFNPSGDQLIAPGVGELNFISFTGGVIKVHKGERPEKGQRSDLPANVEKQALLCAAYVGTTLVTGCFHGELLTWKGKTLNHCVKAHNGCVNAIWPRPNLAGIITGSNDGTVKLWDQSLKEIRVIDISGNELIGATLPRIRSVCESADNNILIGTRSGEIVEITHNTPKVLVRSHARNELFGLAVHPKKSEYVTLGRDGLFAIWDIVTRKQKIGRRLDCGGNSVDFSADGRLGALGLLNGQLMIFDGDSYTLTATRKDTISALQEVKFAPNCTTIATAAADSCVYIYDTTKKYKLLKKLKAHNPIVHIDYSEDSEVIQATTAAMTLACFSVNSGKKFEAGTEIEWSTHTCPAGPLVQGIFPKGILRENIGAVDRASDKSTLASADENGQVRLFKYPCPIEGSSYRMYRGHSGPVSNVKFSRDGHYLISVGASDKSVFQWKFTSEKPSPALGAVVPASDPGLVIDLPLCIDIQTTEERPTGGEENAKKVRLISDIAHSQPKSFVQTEYMGDMPDANIGLRYVHGYRAYDTRNNVKWTKHGFVLYHIGTLGVVLGSSTIFAKKDLGAESVSSYSPSKKTSEFGQEAPLDKQTFFVQHERDIVSIAVHPNGMIAATGELVSEDESPEIYVWNLETKDILARLKGFHSRAVRHLRFSPNGSKLLSIGEDTDHSFALYDWMSNEILASAKVDRDQITACEFKNDSEFVTCGVRCMKFWAVSGYNCCCTRGTMEGFEPFTTVAFAFTSRTCVTGTTLGNIAIWSDRTVTRVLGAHKGMIFAMLSKNNVLITGGQDGLVITWDSSFKQISTIDLNAMTGSEGCIVRAVDINSAGAYLIGTGRAEIIKVQQKKYAVLVSGHYQGELWGLCAAPDKATFATCGGDKTIRVWEVDKVVQSKAFEEEGKACDWAVNGEFIAFGTVRGKIFTLSPADLSVLSSLQSVFETEGSWISDIKIAPDNRQIAFGSGHGSSHIEIVKVAENGTNLQKMKTIDIGLSSGLLHLDWDSQSATLVTNGSSFELVYVNVPTGSVMKAASCSDADWHTWTSIFGFPVKGIALQLGDSISINTVCRSGNKKILAVGDCAGKVKLYKCPCVDTTATCKVYIGHSSRVTKVASVMDRYLVTIGRRDMAVIVWDLSLDTATGFGLEEAKSDKKQSVASPKSEINAKPEDAYDETEPFEANFERRAKREGKLLKQASHYIPVHEMISGIQEPTGFRKPTIVQRQAPKVSLRLQYVYGYRAKNSKNNISYLKDGSIAYHAAALGIVHDKKTNSQRFFNKHKHEIVAIAFHPDGIRVATGDHCAQPAIYVWDSTTCNQVARFQGQLEKGVRSLAFSPTGDYLAAIDMSEYHVLAIYDANNSILLAISKIDRSLILNLAFKTDNELVTVGAAHYMFWEISNKSLTSLRGQFMGENEMLGCVAAEKDLILTGNKAGELYLWNDATIIKPVKKIHEKPIDCIIIAEQIILTGGRDAKVCILDRKFTVLMEINMADPKFNSISPEIRTLSLDKMGKNLLVGTIGAEIYELSIEPSSKTVEAFESIVRSHASPRKSAVTELRGLCVFKFEDKCITASEDGTLRVWNMVTHTQLQLIKLDPNYKGEETPVPDSAKAWAIDVEGSGELAVVGFKDGSLRMLNLPKEATMSTRSDFADSSITVVRISPDRNMVVVGCLAGIMRIYKFPSMESGPELKGHTGAITHVDWSTDSKFLHSNSKDHTLLFWDATTGGLIPTGGIDFRDEKWTTWTCTYGWEVQGIAYDQPVPITSCCRSSNTPHNYPLMAAADATGVLKIFRCPCVQNEAKYLTGKGHASSIASVWFSQGYQTVVTIGLYDGCIFQWEIR